MNQENKAVNTVTGKPLDRVDGHPKVTGTARYAAEIPLDNIAHAVLVSSTIPSGRITRIDTQMAKQALGVLRVLTHLDIPTLGKVEVYPNGGAGQSFMPLQTDRIYYAGQHIALVVAETLEQAEYAASLVRTTYAEAVPLPTFENGLDRAYTPKQKLDATRGNPEQAFAQAIVKLDRTYTTPVEHHNPIELVSTIAHWQGEQLTIYEPVQWVFDLQRDLAIQLNIPQDQVRVRSEFVGGSFGCKGGSRGHTVVTAIAARSLDRPVKLVLSRKQMYTSNGSRPATVQRVRIGADRDGRLTALLQNVKSNTSTSDEVAEPPVTGTTQMLYACPNLAVTHQLVKTNTITPSAMRAPGEGSCLFAIDSAMDELAYELKLDPIELRLRNYAQTDPKNGHPWSSKSLRECYRQGADRFGWSRRKSEPRSMRDGRYLIGWGMSSATYPVYLSPSAARVRLLADGTVVAQSGTIDMGTGTYTSMTMIAADALGVPVEQVRFELGDSRLAKSPVAAGSRSTASVGTAVQAAAAALRSQMIRLAIADSSSPLHSYKETDIDVAQGQMFVKSEPSKSETYAALLKRNGKKTVEAYRETIPPGANNSAKDKILAGLDAYVSSDNTPFSMHSFGAQFCEVRVDPDLGTVRVSRFVGAYGAGRIINRKTAESQLRGAVVMGIGAALLEETVMDAKRGHIVNTSLGEYHVAVNADVPELDVFFVEEVDPHIGPLGAKGVGELGIVGVAAAVANAIYHATGKRVRDLPITLDKLI
jgi:xanthine dehydrogenase YagR molybdenum-binding subunit